MVLGREYRIEEVRLLARTGTAKMNHWLAKECCEHIPAQKGGNLPPEDQFEVQLYSENLKHGAGKESRD